MTEHQKNWALWHTEKFRERVSALSNMMDRYQGQAFYSVIALTISEDFNSYCRTMSRFLQCSDDRRIP